MANEHDISVKITGEVSSLGSATGQSADLLKGLQSVAQQVSAAIQASTKQLVDSMQQGFGALQGTSQQANATMQKGFADTGLVLRSVASAMGETEEAAKDVAVATEKTVDAAKKSTFSWGELGQKLTAVGMALSISVTAPMALATRSIFDATKTMDSIKLSLNAVTGSADGTKRELVDLREVAKLPGLGLKEAAEGAVRLQSSGMSASMAKDALMAYGNALATVGKGKPELDLVTLALSQIQAKGKVMGDDLRQLQEQLPQIRVAMKEAFGTADTEALQKMGVSSEEFIAKTTAAFQKLPSVMSGMRNDMENLQDQWFQALSSMGEGLKPFFSEALKVFTAVGQRIEALGKWFAGLSESQRTWIVSIAAMVAAVGPAIVIAGKLATTVLEIREALNLARTAMIALNLTALANPWVALATAIAAVVVALIGLHDTMQSMGDDGKAARTAASRAAQKDVDSYQYAYDKVSDPKQKAEIGRKLGMAKDRLAKQVEADDAVLASTKFDMGADDAKLENSSKVYTRTPTSKKGKKPSWSVNVENDRSASETEKIQEETASAGLKEGGIGAQREAALRDLDTKFMAEENKWVGHTNVLKALQEKHKQEIAAVNRTYDAKETALQQKADLDAVKERKEVDDKKIKLMTEAFQREQAAYDADLAKKKGYFDTINSAVQNLSNRFGSLASSITSMGIKGDLTFSKLGQSFKEMAIETVASFAGMVAQILAEVALLEVANYATGGMVSMVLQAYNNSASILHYASGGKVGGDGGDTRTNSTELSFAVGTPRVPRDMVAKIHKGETIVPANFAESIRRGDMTLGGPAGSSSSSSSAYHDNRSWTILTTISRAELAPMLDRTKGSVSRGGLKVSH